MSTSHSVIKYLDSPIRILAFSIQDVMLFAAPFLIGSLFDSFLILPGCGIALIVIIKKLLKRSQKYMLVRLMYWKLPTRRFNKLFRTKLPPSNLRLLVR